MCACSAHSFVGVRFILVRIDDVTSGSQYTSALYPGSFLLTGAREDNKHEKEPGYEAKYTNAAIQAIRHASVQIQVVYCPP